MSIRKTIPFLFIVVALLPRPALACSGFVDCLFGFSERTELRATRDIELERIQAERDADVARIDAEAVERVRQAEAEVERVRQMQFATEADRDVAIAEAQARTDEYKSMIAGLISEKTADIKASADTQIAALQEQGKIAIEGIVQTGRTERWRIAGGWGFAIVALFVSGVLMATAMRQQQPQMVIHLLSHERINGLLPGVPAQIIEQRRQKVIHDEE